MINSNNRYQALKIQDKAKKAATMYLLDRARRKKSR